MTHELLLELVFFFPAVLGALAFLGWILYIVLGSRGPDQRSAGPDDLARSA